ncbi:MAG: GH116 family glycosyl-hydrolase [Candidatus Aminicenantes bacterium]|nr:GH116 family glycosyl-hydrolase [Candidatus Aminicenantes bacterium]
MRNRRIEKRLIPVFIACSLIICPLLCSAAAVPSVGRENSEERIRKTLLSQHRELLIEKAVCDEKGREIDGRLGRIIKEARAKGMKSDRQILNHLLNELNFAPANLGRFPECAFDRPIGHTLGRYGKTVAPGNIEAQAGGSACPAGGIGAGSFEWTMSGHYRYWFLKSGWMVDDTVWADQFHVFMKKRDRAITQTLSTGSPPAGSLQSWEWEYPSGKGSYYALFPKSGFSYERNESFPVRLAVTQFSPVIPHNYKESSYPVAVYKWIAENPSSEPAEVSVMLTWQNMIGWEAVPKTNSADFVWDRKSGGNSNVFVQDGPKKGIVFQKKGPDVRTGNAMSGSMCIAAAEVPGKAAVSFHADFDPAKDGSEIWTAFSKDGTLSDSTASRTASTQEELAGAIAVKVTLGPGERVEFPLVIAWDLPYYEFEKGVKYRKKYTDFFGASGERAFVIAGEALDKYRDWEKAIDAWQAAMLAEPRLPGWLKQALFNELYILAETSIWDASTGLHTYLESADYLMYGTFDVDSYCWHILKLWPELELGNIRFFARSVEMEDPAFKQYQYPVTFPGEVPESKMDYYWNTNKVYGMMPHDLGSPRLRPWVVLNGFDWQNGNVWKDLNPKFPLRAYRDFLDTGGKDYGFLADAFRASVVALDTLEKRFGHPDTHIPLNEGIPDQTYDTWKMKGESAYVSILWLAALKSTWTMGQRLIEHGGAEISASDIQAAIAKYRAWFETGRAALQRLWNENGGYFHIDAATEDIMTDQLFGVWYSDMLGLEEEEAQRIISREQARRALRTIFEKNVLGFGGGLMGAVNGRKSDGRQLFSQQGDEVWVGTAYAFAANCALQGLSDEALRTAYGIYHVVYSPFGQGYFFKTPEAYLDPEEAVWNNPAVKNGERLFRAMKYMRPGAVWALYEALLKIVR